MAGGASTISLDVERTHACDVQAKGQIRLRNIQHGSITIGLVLDNGTRATDFLRQDLRAHVPSFNTKSIVPVYRICQFKKGASRLQLWGLQSLDHFYVGLFMNNVKF